MRFSAISRLAKMLATLTLFTASVASSASSITPAGTAISNVATATYFNKRLGIIETVKSNAVNAFVLEVPALEILGRSDLLLTRGAQSQHHFAVKNTGNVPLTVTADIITANEAGVLTNGALYLDQDADGVIDRSDPMLRNEIQENSQNLVASLQDASGNPRFTLPIGDTVSLIYSFRVSQNADLEQVAKSYLGITSSSVASGASVTPTGATLAKVTIVSGGLEIGKSLTSHKVEDGDNISFKIEVRNNSEEDVNGYDSLFEKSLLVDGVQENGVLVRDTIPLNTTFLSFGATGDMQPLFHVRGAPDHEYLSNLPEDKTLIDAVAFLKSDNYPVGHSTTLNFDVFLSNRLGSVDVRNTAETYFDVDGEFSRILSNDVVIRRVLTQDATLDFIAPDAVTSIDYADVGQDVRLALFSGACNTTANIDIVELRVVSALTGDEETVQARETGPNTGEFISVPIPLLKMRTPTHGDGALASDNGDVLSAFSSCGGIASEDTILISPGGFVFHSMTNAPITGATVQLVDENDEVISTTVSDDRGYFSLGVASSGRYRLHVLPPAKLTFPSVRSHLSGFERNAGTTRSYGEMFTHDGGVVAMIDIPLDPFYGIPLALDKSANKRRAQSGEFVTYTIEARNNMDQALIHAEITDVLPRGAVLVSGTVTLDGAPQPDPVMLDSRNHVFSLDTMGPLATKELQYVLRFTPTARSGDRTNLAVLTGMQAGTGLFKRSEAATATVKLNNAGGVFSREATVLGAVYMDCNENGVRDGDLEVGVPGVQIITQEGLIVVTDENGRYSLFGLRPVSHVFAMQSQTLPANTQPQASRAADMLRPISRMIALKRGEVRTENFPLMGCSADTFAEISTRVDALTERTDAGLNLLGDLPMETNRSDTRSVRSEAGLPTATQVIDLSERSETNIANGIVERAEERVLRTVSLEDIIKDINNAFGFLNLKDGQKLDRRTVSVRVKGTSLLNLQLHLNGVPVEAAKVGERVTWEGGEIQALEYVALRLNAGENALKLTGSDPFGNIREVEEITLFAPGDADRIEVIAPKTAPATPGTVVPVVVRVLDAKGERVQAATTVTLSARTAEWDVADIREDQPGVQAYIDNGEASFGLFAPQITGTETVTVRSGIGSASAEIQFVPDLDQRILVGIIEGSVAIKSAGDLIEKNELSAFEDTVEGLRGEVYLRGRIRGDRLLTLRYSSDRDTDDRLFRDIRTDEYYPVYGDNSERGFDGQSSTNLFVKVEKSASYVMYGDIAIEPTDPAFELGGYRDVTTGAKAHWENDDVEINVFAARTAQKSQNIEIAGRGISGPYDIDLSDFREGSEQVALITRDRDTGEVIEEQQLRRLTDYLFDFFRNAIIFNVPVPQYDSAGNPISIQVSYQTEETDAEKYWLYGGEVLADLNEDVRVGVRAVHSDGPDGSDQQFRIHSVFGTADLGSGQSIEGELAHASDGAGNSDTAARLAYVWSDEESKLRVEALHAGENFNPAGTSVRAGATSIRADYERQLDTDRALTLSGGYLHDAIGGSETLSASVGLRYRESEFVSTTSAVKITHDLNADSDATQVSVQKSADWRSEVHEGVKLSFDLGMELSENPHGDLRIAGEYKLESGVRFFGDMEFTFGPEGDRIRTAHLGVDYNINEWLTGRSEVSNDGLTGEHRIIQGFNAQYDVNERVSLRAGLEHSQVLEDAETALTSLSLGGNWASEDENWIAEASVDQTFEAAGRTLFSDVGIAGKINPDLTVVARSRYSLDKRGEGPDTSRHRMRVGAAYRPKQDERLEVLAWYENRVEQKFQREVDHIWSFAATFEPDPRLRLNAKYAGQYSSLRPQGTGDTIESTTQLIQGGLTWEVIQNRFEASLNAYHMWDDQGFATQAVGVEGGFVLDEGTMISLGYNIAKDRYLGGFSHYQDGFYARVRIKLDDGLWDVLDQFLGD